MSRTRSRSLYLWVVFSLLTTFGVDAGEWRWQRIGWEGAGVVSVVCPPDSADVCYLSICNTGPDSPQPGVYKSTDRGITWRYLPESYNPDSGVLTVDPRDQAIVYCGTLVTTLGPAYWPRRSRDAGNHWEEIHGPVDRITASPWQEGLLFGTFRFNEWYLARSTDDGATWEGVSGGLGPYPGMTDNVVFHREDSLLVFAGRNPITQGGRGLGRSTDGGFTWDTVLAASVIWGFDQDPQNASHWGAVPSYEYGEQAYYAESFDNGDTWEERSLPEGVDRVWQMAFDLFDSETIYLVDVWEGYSSLGVCRSTDGGFTWEPMNDGLPDPSGTFEIFRMRDRPGELLAARSDGLWLWTDQQGAEPGDQTISRFFRLESVAPCPFRTRTTAIFRLSDPAMVRADVYSLQGSLVKSLLSGVLAEGQHAISWDGRDRVGKGVSPGTYVLRVESGCEQSTLKVVKVR